MKILEIENKILWSWLKNIFRNSTATMYRLVQNFGGIQNLYRSTVEDLKKYNLKDDVIKKLSYKHLDEAYKCYELCKRHEVNVICIEDNDYPMLLKNIYDPPPVIYVRGNIDALKDRLSIAGVGTRDATNYGFNTAKSVAYELAEAGTVIVSGMAAGIDTAMHTGALCANGITVAVLGTAIDRIYPKENAKLYYQIIKSGAVISEYPPGAVTYATDFICRNRIIAGISNGVFLCQAPKKSGSLITAKIALESGREVFCLPTNTDQTNEGSNALLMAGKAKLILSAEDILNVYKNRFKITETSPKPQVDDKFKELMGTSLHIVEFLKQRSATADEICEAFNMSFADIAAELIDLELADILINENGKYSINY